MQLSFKNGAVQTLAQLPAGAQAYLQRLMELGFLPGAAVVAAGSAPGGDPRIFRVDGSEIALRRDTASHLYISSQPLPESDQL
jgi:Fe2+ transport system protein FeoA